MLFQWNYYLPKPSQGELLEVEKINEQLCSWDKNGIELKNCQQHIDTHTDFGIYLPVV